MKKIIGSIFVILSLMVVVSSCDDSESYADKLKAEKKNIERFIRENNINLIENYTGGVMQENDFYFDNTSGIYINVVDTGNGKRASSSGNLSRVNVHFSDTWFLPVDGEPQSNMGPSGDHPIVFTYGLSPESYINGSTSDLDSYLFLSPALVAPLKYVGEEGIVKLLIPFTQGSYYQQYDIYAPLYMGMVKYERIR